MSENEKYTGVFSGDLINKLETYSLKEVEKTLKKPVESLSYEILNELFPKGSDDEEVAEILRQKRQEHLSSQGKGEQQRYYIGHDGRIATQAEYDSMTPSEKRGFHVGATCFHYNSGTPGMDSNPEDRW